MTRPVVYDLDGTLVRLAVNWKRAAMDAEAALSADGFDVDGRDLWQLLELAEREDAIETFERAVRPHEVAGAERSQRLPLADELLDRRAEVGVCSLNCEAACHTALDVHDLTHAVDAVVGRDSVGTRKPHPEPLLATIEAMGVARDEVVFVGDSERDAVTAEEANVEFRWVD